MNGFNLIGELSFSKFKIVECSVNIAEYLDFKEFLLTGYPMIFRHW